jgi:hypothetical protein
VRVCFSGWPGLEGGSPKPRGFLRSAQSSPGHPFHQSTTDEAPELRILGMTGLQPRPEIIRTGPESRPADELIPLRLILSV